MEKVIYLLLSIGGAIGAVILLTYKSWLDGFRPDWFYIFNIYENNFLNYVEHKIFIPLKGKKDSYKIGDCEYDKKGVKPYINSKGVYTWNFAQGQLKPILLSILGTNNIDGKLIAEVKKETLDDLWYGANTMEDFLKTWGVVILAIIMLAMLGYFVSQGQQTNQLLANLTRSR